jgi:hypothetical protein
MAWRIFWSDLKVWWKWRPRLMRRQQLTGWSGRMVCSNTHFKAVIDAKSAGNS